MTSQVCFLKIRYLQDSTPVAEVQPTTILILITIGKDYNVTHRAAPAAIFITIYEKVSA